ncbi:hypothetical protein [Oceanidesulfovibrio marinus]|uniref:DUF2971 domain-containing protein n=1 Tax=Oceanidesulfovibrio marinus TaxID=370038 RepID=A0ABX6NA17_9BACT|nr:hypothetical protein [Oceanidesulfovibrio marinus]QJT07414.1 hypothetical protein E8L03_00125 [Oceanidesulfovibrio marinus]
MSYNQYLQVKQHVLESRSDRRFYYFKDRYALMLLRHFVGEGKSVREIKESPFAKLLGRPVLKELLARRGGACITGDDLVSIWPAVPECFHIAIDDWGSETNERHSWCQTSRPGMNLVVMLNFSNTHNNMMFGGVPNQLHRYFCYEDHPHTNGQCTMAWSRVDIAEDGGEALIEEVQNDWLREAEWYLYLYDEDKGPRGVSPKEHRCLVRYAHAVLERYAPIWQEAMLAAALQVLKNDLGIGTIYYHTFEGGNLLKNMTDDFAPPRSIYTQLPKRFCFPPTTETPAMLAHELERLQDRKGRPRPVRFQKLEL